MVSRLCLVLFHRSMVPLKNVPLGVYVSHWQERPPKTVLYGGRQSGGFVNSAVKGINEMYVPQKQQKKSSVTKNIDIVTVMTSHINVDPVHFRNLFILCKNSVGNQDENKQHKSTRYCICIWSSLK